ncbi:MAG: hypothetical protein WCK67_09380 [bacterium]
MADKSDYILWGLIITSVVLFKYSFEHPNATFRNTYEPIKITEPIQTQLNAIEPITIKDGNDFFKITPQANYSIYAKIVSKKEYGWGWDGKLVPMDLALAWGNLLNTKNDNHISYSQSGRWYFFEYDAEYPYDVEYVLNHSANNHIIPADSNIKNALKSVDRGQMVLLDGYLVNVNGLVNGDKVVWNSSLSRTDRGNGACELFYVKSVRIGDRVYR